MFGSVGSPFKNLTDLCVPMRHWGGCEMFSGSRRIWGHGGAPSTLESGQELHAAASQCDAAVTCAGLAGTRGHTSVPTTITRVLWGLAGWQGL